MTAFVVDTNVAIVANGGGDENIDEECLLTCANRLERLVEKEAVAIDETGHILGEYADHLSWSGGPGVGDAFFKYLVDNQYRHDRVKRVAVTPSVDDRRGFEELPENTFDRSDRKFLAVATTANAVILNATDSDWGEHHELMNKLGVDVDELCPHELRQNRGRRGQL